MPSLAVIFVEYGRIPGGPADQTFALLQHYLSSLKGCRITYIRVDNKHECMPVTQIGSNIFAVGGDNSSREFSGWQRGINTLAALHRHYDLVLITNEMFLKTGPSFLENHATPELLVKSISEKIIIGRIDTAFLDLELFGYDVSTWVCTNCVLIPKQAIDALGTIALINENIHRILPHAYDPRHCLTRAQFSLESGGDFLLECDLPACQSNAIRVKFVPIMVKQGSRTTDNSRQWTAILDELAINNLHIAEKCFARGLFSNHGALWSKQSFLLDLPADPAYPQQLRVKGTLLPESLHEIFNHGLSVEVYNDAVLYQENAPINKAYQRWIVEWLTEKWHSRFEIDQNTWELFKTKAAAIFNESLLTAKFRELGFPPAPYRTNYRYQR